MASYPLVDVIPTVIEVISLFVISVGGLRDGVLGCRAGVRRRLTSWERRHSPGFRPRLTRVDQMRDGRPMYMMGRECGRPNLGALQEQPVTASPTELRLSHSVVSFCRCDSHSGRNHTTALYRLYGIGVWVGGRSAGARGKLATEGWLAPRTQPPAARGRGQQHARHTRSPAHGRGGVSARTQERVGGAAGGA